MSNKNISRKVKLSEAVESLVCSQRQMNENFALVFKEYFRQHHRETIWSWVKALLVPIATVVAVLISIHYNSAWEYKHQLNLIRQERINILYKRGEQTQSQINVLHVQHKAIMDSMSNIRSQWSLVARTCSQNPGGFSPKGLGRLYSMGYSYASIGFIATSYFDEKVIKPMLQFAALASVDSHKICKVDQSKLLKLKNIQINVSHRIILKIKQEENNKAAINKKIAALQKKLFYKNNSLS